MTSVHHRRVDDAATVVRSIVRELGAKNVTFMAASIAYSAFVSLFPLLVLLLLVATALGGEALAARLVGLAGDYLTPAGQGLLTDAITRAARRIELSVLGLVTLVWGVSKAFRAIDTAFAAIYETAGRNDLPGRIRDVLVVVGAVGTAIVVTAAAGAAFALFRALPYLGVLNPLLLVVGLTLVFLPVYYVFPDTPVSLRDVLPGAVLLAVGWAALEAGFQVYVSLTAKAQLYGVIGWVLLLVTWLYVGSLLLLVGATTNAVLARWRTGGVPAAAPPSP